jgi:hypothetical protein
MRRIYNVTDSSTIETLEYDFDSEKLVVEFKAGSKYLYRDVPENVAREFFLAESKGKHFAAHIKDKYVTEKIGAALNPPKAYKAPIAKPAVPATVKAYKAPKAQPDRTSYWPFPTKNRP